MTAARRQITGTGMSTMRRPDAAGPGVVALPCRREPADRQPHRQCFLLVGAQALVRHGLALMLQTGWPGCQTRQATSGEEAERLLPGLGAIDLVMLDLEAAGPGGEAAVRRLATACAPAPLVVTCGAVDGGRARHYLALGARAVVLKTDSSEVLENAVALVLSGESCVCLPRAAAQPVAGGTMAEALPDLTRLTLRQRQIFDLLQKGCSNKEIARQLGVLEGTVKVHVRSMMQKLGVSNRTQVAVMATRCHAGAGVAGR